MEVCHLQSFTSHLPCINTLDRPSIAETGIPHATTEDDEFEGYHIPAGTVVTYNHWGIANDPTEYDQPERFWPERFLDEDLDKFLKGHLGFGAGKLTLFPETFGRECAAHPILINVLCVKAAGPVSPTTLQSRVCSSPCHVWCTVLIASRSMGNLSTQVLRC